MRQVNNFTPPVMSLFFVLSGSIMPQQLKAAAQELPAVPTENDNAGDILDGDGRTECRALDDEPAKEAEPPHKTEDITEECMETLLPEDDVDVEREIVGILQENQAAGIFKTILKFYLAVKL